MNNCGGKINLSWKNGLKLLVSPHFNIQRRRMVAFFVVLSRRQFGHMKRMSHIVCKFVTKNDEKSLHSWQRSVVCGQLCDKLYLVQPISEVWTKTNIFGEFLVTIYLYPSCGQLFLFLFHFDWTNWLHNRFC